MRREGAFDPYLVKTIRVAGHDHKIGILGLENADCPRWDLPARFPGMVFCHPDNEEYSMAWEVERYVPEMREQGCEFIIVSYHAGLGSTDGDLEFGTNTDNQGKRVAETTDCIDFLILGHDHTTSYSNTFVTNAAGDDVPIVNGGGQELTESVFRFSEDEAGLLTWELLDTKNLVLDDYAVDKELEEKIRPYAELAEEKVSEPVGTLSGDWGQSRDFYTTQTSTTDLSSASMLWAATEGMAEELTLDKVVLPRGLTGLDHLDADMSMGTAVVSGGYVVGSGPFTVKDACRAYRFVNSLMVLPLRGSEIRAIMEENASERLMARLMRGQAYFHWKGETNTDLIFGGLNFTYDMARPEGERVVIEGFSNGRTFEDDGLYLAVVTDFILGNIKCGLRDYSEDDAIWSLPSYENIQDCIAEYVRAKSEEDGSLTPEAITWKWSITYSGDVSSQTPDASMVAATLVDEPVDGRTYLLYAESEGYAVTAKESKGGLKGVAVTAAGDALTKPLPDQALAFVAHVDEEGQVILEDEQGRYLSALAGGGLTLTDEAQGDLSRWRLESGYGGWHIVSVGDTDGRAMEYFGGTFTTYWLARSSSLIFNFYEVEQ